MTCIVGLVTGGGVLIAGDSAGAAGHHIEIRKDPKAFVVGAMAIGFTSSFRMGQALMFGWTPPKRHSDIDVFEWMCTDVVDAIRRRLGDAGVRRSESGVESCGSFLIGVHGRLFGIDDDFQVREVHCGFDAVGCGADLAKGSLHSTEGRPAEERVLTALEAAARFSAWVSPPFKVLHVSGTGDAA